jgi:hypothetical protein
MTFPWRQTTTRRAISGFTCATSLSHGGRSGSQHSLRRRDDHRNRHIIDAQIQPQPREVMFLSHDAQAETGGASSVRPHCKNARRQGLEHDTTVCGSV